VDHLPEVDVAKIMRQIREQASRQRRQFPLSSTARLRSHSQTAEDLSLLQSSQDISQVRLSSHRKMLGDIIVFAKKVLRQLLTPILARQSAYNAANARLAVHLCERLARVEEQVATVLEALQAEEPTSLKMLRETVTEPHEVLAQQQATAWQGLQMEVTSQSKPCRAQQRHLMRSLGEVQKPLFEPSPQKMLQSLAEGGTRAADAFLAALDEQCRGGRADIKERLCVYLPTLQESKVGTEDSPIVDLGCRRGEWLEVLGEVGIKARGVEPNQVLAEDCRQHGFDVVESDILTYLHDLPSSSLGGVTGFHLIEHLPFDILLNLFDETVRVLQPGGVAIFETPNPHNVLVSTQEFYLDPTHRNPLPSSLLQFIAEVKGLCRIKLLHLHPFPEALKVQEAGLDVAKRFNEVFYGPRDYALIGWKA
jgi:SAM-dependent methyltransferase